MIQPKTPQAHRATEKTPNTNVTPNQNNDQIMLNINYTNIS
jgi:hypothetical protein